MARVEQAKIPSLNSIIGLYQLKGLKHLATSLFKFIKSFVKSMFRYSSKDG
jgi:hypothetical protein